MRSQTDVEVKEGRSLIALLNLHVSAPCGELFRVAISLLSTEPNELLFTFPWKKKNRWDIRTYISTHTFILSSVDELMVFILLWPSKRANVQGIKSPKHKLSYSPESSLNYSVAPLEFERPILWIGNPTPACLNYYCS